VADPTIRVRISGDSSGLDQTLERSKSGVMGLASSLRGLAGALGIGLGVSQAVSFGRSLLDAADAAADTAKGLGESLANVVAMQKLASLAGVDQDKALNWLQKMKAIKEDIIESNGSSATSRKLLDIGVDLNDIANGSLARGIELIVAAANNAGGSVKTLNELFGKLSAVDLKDTMGRGLDSVTESANKTAEATQRLADAKERLDKLSAGAREGGTTFLADVIETNQRVVRTGRNGGPAPTGFNAVAEGVGAGVTTFGLQFIKLFAPEFGRFMINQLEMLPKEPTASKKEPEPVVITGVKPVSPVEELDDRVKRQEAEFKEWSKLADERYKAVEAQDKKDRAIAALNARADEQRSDVRTGAMRAIDGLGVDLPRLSGIEALGGIMGGTGGYAYSAAERDRKRLEIETEARDHLKKIDENTDAQRKVLEGE
jgi:hypothetical protein